MAIHGESNRRPAPPRASRAGLLVPACALVLAATAAGGAWWLSAAGPTGTWETVLHDLTASSENCSLETDTAARAAAKVARSQSQLEGFIRERFEQLHDRALSANQEQRLAMLKAAQARAAATPTAADDEATRMRSRLAGLIAQRAELLDRFTPEHPQIADLSHQINTLDAEVATLGPPAPSVESADEAVEIEPVPADAWRTLVEQSAVDYQQLAAVCRRAERQLDDAQAAQAAALDRHLGQLARLDAAAAAWNRLAAAATTVSQGLWSVAGIALAVLGWLALRGIAGQLRPKAHQVITHASQIDRWFSLPFVAVAAAGERPQREEGKIPHWLVLPAQLVVAMAVFLIVAATIQNPAWLGNVAGDPWQAIGHFWNP